MRNIFICILLLGSKLSVAQSWTAIENTTVKYTLVVYETDTLVIFKRASNTIIVPPALSADFRELFKQNERAFSIISDSSIHYGADMINDTVQHILKADKLRDPVFIISRNIVQENGIEKWGLKTLYGQGQPCWPGIIIMRSKKEPGAIQFLSFARGFCEI
ncbi:MAG: hypothetical protein JNM88_19125 [Chitinophagaceae bacterium]|nr:hypothetical protein [Chitinophagaceae bacterium]